MGLAIEQPLGPRYRHTVWCLLVQTNGEKLPQRERIGQSPRNAALAMIKASKLFFCDSGAHKGPGKRLGSMVGELRRTAESDASARARVDLLPDRLKIATSDTSCYRKLENADGFTSSDTALHLFDVCIYNV